MIGCAPDTDIVTTVPVRRVTRRCTVDLKSMVLKVHFMLKLHIANLALDPVAVLQMRQVFSPEIFAQIAGTVEFVDGFAYTRAPRLQG